MSAALFEYLCRLGDNTLVLGHRVSEWCGRAPVLEEDIALANTALDLIGQTQMWLGLAGEVEAAGRSADDLAYFRDAGAFRNLLLVEQPNRDFGHTILRQFLFDAYQEPLLARLQQSRDDRICGIAAKVAKETAYHLDRSRALVIALGDGTDESHTRMQTALDRLWPFVGEMFIPDPIEVEVNAAGLGPVSESLRAPWDSVVGAALTAGGLTPPAEGFAQTGGKTGTRHTEHLGHMLATMQVLPRSYPDAVW